MRVKIKITIPIFYWRRPYIHQRSKFHVEIIHVHGAKYILNLYTPETLFYNSGRSSCLLPSISTGPCSRKEITAMLLLQLWENHGDYIKCTCAR